MATVAIGTPHGGDVSPLYYRHLLQMQSRFPQHRYLNVEVDMMIVGKARNMLVETALSLGADFVWFIDNDILVPEDAGVLIDDAIRLGVVSGLYFNRRPPYTPQVYSCATELEFAGKYWPVIDYPESGIVQVDAVGAGCLIVPAQVFRSMMEPWKQETALAGQALAAGGFPGLQPLVSGLSPWFEFMETKGEDLYFCERLKALGVPVFVNYGIKCQHLTLVPITESQFKYLKDNNLILKGDVPQ